MGARFIRSLFVAACFLAGGATADPLPRRFAGTGVGSYEASVPVSIFGEDNQRLVVGVHPDGNVTGGPFYIAQCATPCTVRIPRGRYRIFVASTPDTFGGGRREFVDGPMQLIMQPRPRSQRTLGAVLGVLGPVALISGMALMVSGLNDSLSGPGSPCSNDCGKALLGGLTLTLAGAAMTPIGWVLFGKSFHPGIDVEQGTGPTFAPRFGIVPLPGGVGFGAALSM